MQINKFNFLLEKIEAKTDLYDDEGISLKFDDNSKLMF